MASPATALTERLVNAWYAPRLTALTALLLPLSWIFSALTALRRSLYRNGLLRIDRVRAPVVVIGNVTVGGTGKTPVAIALARALRDRGFAPAIVSRGFGGAAREPLEVLADSDPRVVGDEPVLLARSGFPTVVGHDRAAAARVALAAHPRCDVVIADDGLQHYRLARDAEIVVVDAVRAFGNGCALPAGPLREPRSRIASADAVVWMGAERSDSRAPGAFAATLEGERFACVADTSRTAMAHELRVLSKGAIHAIAGIGHPERFFAQLRALGLDIVAHAFPDHHAFAPADLAFPHAGLVVMTEKDAVKCAAFADERMWYLPVVAKLDPALVALVEQRIRGRQAARDPRLSRHQGSARL